MLESGLLAGIAKVAVVGALMAGGGAGIYLVASTSARDQPRVVTLCPDPTSAETSTVGPTLKPQPTSTPEFFTIGSPPRPLLFSVRSGEEFSVFMGPSERPTSEIQSDLLFDTSSVQIVSIVAWNYERGDWFIISAGSGGAFKDVAEDLALANRTGRLSNVSALIREASGTLMVTPESVAGTRRGIDIRMRAIGEPHTQSALWTAYPPQPAGANIPSFQLGLVEIGDRLDVTATPTAAPSTTPTPEETVPCVTLTSSVTPIPTEATETVVPTASSTVDAPAETVTQAPMTSSATPELDRTITPSTTPGGETLVPTVGADETPTPTTESLDSTDTREPEATPTEQGE